MKTMIRTLSRFFLLPIVALSLLAPAQALQPDELLDDPVKEQRAREISAGLRCLVCQNQSIDDSDAPLARDLRLLVRERVEAGYTNAQVEAFVVQRYGDFVLLRPPVNAQTILLWVAPALVLLAGASGIFLATRRRRTARVATAALSEQEQQELARILEKDASR